MKMKFHDSLSVFLAAWLWANELEAVAEIERISQIYRLIFYAFECELFLGFLTFFGVNANLLFVKELLHSLFVMGTSGELSVTW